jgi:nucleoside-diphosphate-sugar epimerase
VINAAQEAGCEGILQVSSAEIYGDGVEGLASLDESAPVLPHSSYGASKAVIDALVQVRWKEARTPAIALRQFNCVGERETHPYIVPEIISQLSRGSEVHLGNNSERDFQYAGDAVAMAVELLENGDFGQVYNMGSQQSIHVYELAKLIARIMGVNITIVEDESRKRPWEIWCLRSNNTKLYSTISTRPQVSLEGALVRAINDFRSNGSKWSWE